MDFYDRVGKVALGSRLRRLGDLLAEDATKIYALYGSDLQPRWYPVYQYLLQEGEASVSAIGEAIGHSHASISQIVRDMVKGGFAALKKCDADGRVSLVALTQKGRGSEAALQKQSVDVLSAVEAIQRESGVDLWKALAATEKVLAGKSLFQRVQESREGKSDRGIRVVDYSPLYAKAFRDLNEAWIRQYFAIEAADRKALHHPDKNILQKGGHILVALDGEQPVGVCALLPHGEKCFELAKMAVDPSTQGKGIGRTLGEAAIAWAKAAGAARIFLESNTILESAIRLYRKLGFQEISGEASPYQRCNIQMELRLGRDRRQAGQR